MKYKIILDNNNYVVNYVVDKDGQYNDEDIRNIFDNFSHHISSYILNNDDFIFDEEKEKETVKNETISKRKAELHNLLNESDYIVARTFEQVMSCTNPLTFITDIIAIITKFSAQYGEVIANRQTWRDELEAMEATNNE